MKKSLPRLTSLTLILCLAAAGLFYILYYIDNKYTTRADVSQDGVVSLLEPSDNSDDIAWLVEGWDFYPDQIIEPGETGDNAIHMYIGQFFSFSAFHSDGSPYGLGTYAITLRGTGTYSLLLPEVFCACRVYVNGELVSSSGFFSPYSPHVTDLIIPVEADSDTEILIQVMNYTHYYSGITYPPAIGSPEAISRLVTSRMIFYGFLCFTSLALALFSAAIWFGQKDRAGAAENRWLGILSLAFALHICYPFVRFFGVPVTEPLYALEDATAALVLLCVAKIISMQYSDTEFRLDRILTGISSGFVVICTIFPLFLLQKLPGFVPIYGQIVFWYKAVLSVLMLLLILSGCMLKPKVHTALLIPGLAFYAVSLTAHAVTLGSFEPARTGWFEEWGAYILVIFFAIRMAVVNISLIKENQHLNAHLQEEVLHKTQALSTLLDERRTLLASFAHDLKTPITSITTFTRLVELDNTGLDDEARQYLDTIRKKTREMQLQINYLSEFTRQDVSAASFLRLDLCSLVKEFYELNKPDIDVAGLDFQLSLPHLSPLYILGDRERLINVLQNLVYNAVSFTPENGVIRLTLRRSYPYAVIRVEDTGEGIEEECLPDVFNRYFTKRRDNSGQGLGLYIVKTIVMEHGGDVSVSSTPGEGSIFTVRLPLSESEQI